MQEIGKGLGVIDAESDLRINKINESWETDEQKFDVLNNQVEEAESVDIWICDRTRDECCMFSIYKQWKKKVICAAPMLNISVVRFLADSDKGQ